MTYTHRQLDARARQRADAEWAQKVRRAEQAVQFARHFLAEAVLAAHANGWRFPVDKETGPIVAEIRACQECMKELRALEQEGA